MTRFRTLEVGWRYSDVARRHYPRTFCTQAGPTIRQRAWVQYQAINNIPVRGIRPQIRRAWRPA